MLYSEKKTGASSAVMPTQSHFIEQKCSKCSKLLFSCLCTCMHV